MERLVPWLAAVVLVGAMAAPALSDPPRDDFPLSTYPMFATHRGDQVEIPTAVGVGADGEIMRLSPGLLAGANEPILAVRTAATAVGTGEAASWCAEVSRRLHDDGGYPGITKIEVRTERHDVLGTVIDGDDPLAIDVHAQCGVVKQ